MLLYTDTTENDEFLLGTFEPGRKLKLKKVKDSGKLSERLLPAILEFLKAEKISLQDLKKIAVKTGPGNFSRIRSGVATANALGYGLNIGAIAINSTDNPDFEKIYRKKGGLAAPNYGKRPNITKPKRKL